jgi:hypothetical protein
MKAYWDSLRPMEKRLVVVVGVVLLFVLNGVFIVPHFSDLGLVAQRHMKAQQSLAKYNAEIAQRSFYQSNVDRLLGKGQQDIQPEDQANAFRDVVYSQATRSGAAVNSVSKLLTHTNNVFFLKLSQVVSVECNEQQLVNFLYNLGNDKSQTRVRDLTMRPDPQRYKLNANVTLEASYEKAAPAKGAAPGPKNSGPPPRPASNTTAAR